MADLLPSPRVVSADLSPRSARTLTTLIEAASPRLAAVVSPRLCVGAGQYAVHFGGPAPLDAQGRFRAAVSIMRGTQTYHALCWLSFCSSCAFAVVGVLRMCPGWTDRVTAYQSLCFLVASGFTLARVARDKMVADLHAGMGDDLARGFLEPARPYLFQAAMSFAVALGFFGHSVHHVAQDLGVDPAYTSFYVNVTVWCIVSAMFLSKCLRDRHDACLWEQADAETQARHIDQVLTAAAGSPAYRILVWASTAVATSGTLLCLARSSSALTLEAKGFFALGFLFCITTSFHLAKLVRDHADPHKKKALSYERPFQLLVIGSFGVSAVCVVLGGLRLAMPEPERLFVCSGSAFSVLSALCLAKDVRDRLEIRLLREVRAPAPTSPKFTA